MSQLAQHSRCYYDPWGASFLGPDAAAAKANRRQLISSDPE
jgi:hypothetical protein